LRKRFCRKFNFELQAAATEDNIVISLTQAHSFPLDEVVHYLHSASVRNLLTQAMLDSPMFTTRWRWVVGVALALPRFRGGRKVAPQLARMAYLSQERTIKRKIQEAFGIAGSRADSSPSQPRRPHLLADLEPGEARHHPVEHRHQWPVGPSQGAPRLVAGRDHGGRVAGLLHRVLQHPPRDRLVVGDQHPYRARADRSALGQGRPGIITSPRGLLSHMLGA